MVKRVLAMMAMLMLILAVAGCGSSGSGGDEELQKVATPVIAPKGEKYFNSTEITIITQTAGAVIRYTTDGSEPDSDSKIYNSAITIIATTTIKAKAFKDGMTESDTVTEIFTIQEVGLEKIEITSQPTKTSYYVGDKNLDITGLEVTGTYNNGSSKKEIVSLSNITGFDTTTSGEKTLTVTLSGKTATFKITVVDLILTGITITKQPAKRSYYIGDAALDITGLEVTGTYNNGSSKPEQISLNNITGFDTSIVGEKTLTVTLSGKTAIFEITVVDVISKVEFILKRKVDILELNEYSAIFEVIDSMVTELKFSGTDSLYPLSVKITDNKGTLSSIKVGQEVKEIIIKAVDINENQIGNTKKVMINN